jgi:hypothetical protein
MSDKAMSPTTLGMMKIPDKMGCTSPAGHLEVPPSLLHCSGGGGSGPRSSPRGMSGASYLIFVELEFSFDCSPTLPGCLHHNWCPVVTAGVHILQASCQSSAAASGVRSRMELSVPAEDRVTVPLFCFLFYHIHAGTHTVTHIHALCTYIYTQHLHLHTQHIQTHMPTT